MPRTKAGSAGGITAGKVASARLCYWIMRYVVGIKDMPSTGADFFVLDAKVVSAYRQFEERGLNIVSLITWMGFRQERIFYTKQQRAYGTSRRTFSKKLKLAIDSVTPELCTRSAPRALVSLG